MTWEEELFGYLDDLEGRAAALYDAERAPEIADRGAAEYQAVTLVSRLMASVDLDVSLEVCGIGAVSGRLARAATAWCLLESRGQEWVVRIEAVTAVHGASDRALPEPAWPAAARLGLTSALRRLADLGDTCVVHLGDGRRHDGTIRRVGGDFVEVAAGAAGRVVLVPFTHLSAVLLRRRSAADGH